MWLTTLIELEQNYITSFSVLTSCSSEFVVNFYRLFTPSSHLGPFKWYQSQGHRLIEGLTSSMSKDGSSYVQPCGGQTTIL
jgi:hypothetical protein